MIPLEPISLETKLFFLSAVEFGSRLFRGPVAPDRQGMAEWLELVTLAPAELVNMLPDDRPVLPGMEPDFALPALLARLTEMDDATQASQLPEAFARLFGPGAAPGAVPGADGAMPLMAHQLALDLEYLIALLAKGFLGGAPDMAAQAGAMCRDVLAPRLADLEGRLAAGDHTGVFATAAAVMLHVVRDLGQKL
ncbi:hypothetical protein G3N56_01490 [Desulfovibrio sulfodismutans]|uniref:Uncharacterized protein n=2 Tax=Desulfolutivibrio sulfodismutans TaxID=63561 RepID=A0A7K3NGU1_9BACT|nr:hypothetical protein [Desulfolutivibrio sulfodismutans]NDY55416.1 hypothetical protein [Desulfolutivibrio sulfodismutans]